jgi:dihydroorotase
MDRLLKQVVIQDPASGYHGQRMDVWVENGRIREIASSITPSDKAISVIEVSNLHLAPGWVDIGVQGGEPGLEHREDLQSLRAAAAAGGFTCLGLWPNLVPVTDSKADILFLRNETENGLVECLPLGAATAGCKGEAITEMLDMRSAGALAFTDGLKPIAHAGLLQRALMYVKGFDGILIHFPQELSVAPGGQMHEGPVSTRMGLRGIPALAEQLMVSRDLALLEYTGSRLHLANISTADAVEQIRRAKDRGLRVTCSVPVLNLVLEDEALSSFDCNLKVMPPLRERSDREALIEGLVDGTIDCISSNHVPLDPEAKDLEFPYADFGAIGLETCFALLQTHLSNRVHPDRILQALSHNPRQIFGLPALRIEAGEAANFTLYQPDEAWTLEETDLRSRSRNSHFLGASLRGRVWGVCNRGHWWSRSRL